MYVLTTVNLLLAVLCICILYIHVRLCVCTAFKELTCCGLWPVVSTVLWMRQTNSCGLQTSSGEKGQHSHPLNERASRPLSGQAFIALLGALPQGRSLFIIVRQ